MSRQDVAAVQQHYESFDNNSDLVARVIGILDKFEGPLTSAHLSQLDQLHLRGLEPTKELAKLAQVAPDMKVLDAGSGLGGPARYLAEAYGCNVVGVDLTPSFIDLSRVLTERIGLSDRVRFEVGNLLDLPFADQLFDLVWTQHVVMNIPDRARLYREFRRVLKPGGRLAFYDLFAPDAGPPITFPVPWAATNKTSFVLTKSQTIDALTNAGFAGGWHDVTDQMIAGFELAPVPQTLQPGALNLSVALGSTFPVLAANATRNIMEGRIRAAMGIYDLVN